MNNATTQPRPLLESDLFRQVKLTALQMLRIIEDPASTDEDRSRACSTIRDSLQIAESPKQYGRTLGAPQFQGPGQGQITTLDTARLETQEANFWEKVRQLMKAKAVTQMQLADRMATTQPAVSQMLNRRCRPQRATILSLATALSVEPQELWPQLDVTDILDNVAAFHQEQAMSEPEAEAIRNTLKREPANAPAASLPKRKR